MSQNGKIGTTHYNISGNGAPIVLLPGLGLPSGVFIQLESVLARTHKCISVDPPGSGRSPLPKGSPSVDLMADAIAELMVRLSLPRATIMGHSLGGFTALRLAISHPDLVKNLILIGSCQVGASGRRGFVTEGTPTEAAEANMRACTAPVFPTANREAFTRAVKLAVEGRGAPGGFSWQLEAAKKFNVSREIRKVECPAILIHGALDRIIPLGLAEETARSLPHGELAALGPVGHMPHLEAPEEVLELVLGFLGAHSGDA